jgi:hypothetical protein
MLYLEPSEYEQYGLEATTSEAMVRAASALIDSLCRRPSLGVTQFTERVRVAPGTARARLAYLPLCAADGSASPIVRVRVRYGAADQMAGDALGFDIARAFGLTGSWVEADITKVEWTDQTGEIGLPLQVLGLDYLEAEITYTAGFPTVPDSVKLACAQLVRNAEATPALNVRRTTLDTMQMEYFRDSVVDDTVTHLVAPYVAMRLGA